MANDNEHTWKRLGELLQERRIILNPKWRDRQVFAKDTGLHYRLAYDIEGARRTNFVAATRTVIEIAYQLKPGAITEYLEGGELTPADAPTPPGRVVPFPSSDVTAQLGPRPAGVSPAAIPEALTILRQLWRLARQPNPIPEDQATGTDLFGPGLNADSWDQLRQVDQLGWQDAVYSLAEVFSREKEMGLRSGSGGG